MADPVQLVFAYLVGVVGSMILTAPLYLGGGLYRKWVKEKDMWTENSSKDFLIINAIFGLLFLGLQNSIGVI